MIDARKMIEDFGLEASKRLVESKADRRRLDLAATMLSDDDAGLSVCHAGFALTSLPHKEPGVDLWRREGHRITLVVQSGIDRQGQPLGIPYGSKARMILLYLQTIAVRTGSREVELGSSMRAWLSAMGQETVGGKTYRLIVEQATRIGACRLTFFADLDGGGEVRSNGAFVDSAFSLAGMADDDTQPRLWQDRVQLNEAFYQSLIDHPVPISELALREIGGKSMAIDVYIWLAYRLHALDRPMPVTWLALHRQFGAGVALVKHFKRPFAEALATALAAYPGAHVDIDDAGIVLHPSRPPIAKASARLGRI